MLILKFFIGKRDGLDVLLPDISHQAQQSAGIQSGRQKNTDRKSATI